MPDTLSRLPLPSTGDALADGYTDHLISQIRPHGISFAEVQQCTAADPTLQSECHFIDTHWPDLLSPYSTAPHHQQFIVSIVDYYSSFPEVLLTTDIQASAIICWLRERFARYGCICICICIFISDSKS